MTESASAPTVPATKSSFWEDVIDIFVQPAAVFRGRENTSPWPPMLFVAISIALIFFVTFNTLEPIFDAEFTRNAAKSMAKNPQLTPEIMEKMRGVGVTTAKYGLGIIMLITMFVIGAVSWLVGKLFDSKQSFQAALVVAAWAYMPRVLGTLLGGIQGLIMDPAKLTSQMSISLSPARFMDQDTTNPILYQFLGRFDLITIWVTVLLAIGFYVTSREAAIRAAAKNPQDVVLARAQVAGKVSKGRAAVFGAVMWLLGAVPALRQAMM